MGAPADRAKTDKGLWSMFLANMTSSDVHSQALNAYVTDKAAYDALPVQARITKPTLVILIYVHIMAVDTGQPALRTAHRRATHPANVQASRPRDKRRTDTSTAQPTQRQRIEGLPGHSGTSQNQPRRIMHSHGIRMERPGLLWDFRMIQNPGQTAIRLGKSYRQWACA